MSDLKKLLQREAASLLGLNARLLRDDGSVPRNADGSYDGTALLSWARGRIESPKTIPDADYEKLLLIVDELGEPCESTVEAIVGIIANLRSRCGDSVFVELGTILLERWQRTADWLTEFEADPAQRRRHLEAEKHRRLFDEKRSRLEVAAVCDDCRKIRMGRKWVTAKVASDTPTIPGMCPDCAGGEKR